MTEKKEEVKKVEKTLREKILAAKDIQSEILDIKEWGVKIYVSSLNVKERGKVRKAAQTKMSPDGDVTDFDAEELEIAAMIAGAKDPDTKEPIFKREDATALMEKNVKLVDIVALKILDLSGMGPEAGEIRKRRFSEGQ